ncbi:tannase/feruloyl esterase family alpha/beta hydrolase [Novosphingobium terrae]|uniref:tannase/feruloyl esterase family alpha/beta hydrolase n=1 Tax=Novosphingobium terrae TaxID=2726189 RepID=UPI00197FF108|nr:tannase/feruloyl esterase family alpha/beta hydrolase [Novosphingobium terrae]
MRSKLSRSATQLAILPLAFTLGGGVGHASPASSTSCDAAARATLSDGQITGATLVAQGAMPAPPGFNGAAPNQASLDLYASLPAFCRIQADLHPAPDSDIKIEVWAPVQGWNGRLQLLGNGGYQGAIQYGDMALGLSKSYAVASSDTGHRPEHNQDFYVGHPEKVVDWEVRAVHETAVAAKAVVASLFGTGPKYSYWNSCSTGGRQGWIAAEYYPQDFDGLAIGDPANPMTRLQGSSLWLNLMLNRSATSFISQEKWALIHQSFTRACDAQDGLKDGLVENPLACRFDPQQLLCKGEDQTSCLTAPQLDSLRAVTRGMRSKSGQQLYPGYPMGSALLPGPVGGKNPDPSAPQTYRILYKDPSWDFHRFDVETDIPRADRLGYQTMNAVNPEKLKALFARGGKVLMYHGWDDPAITPMIGLKLYSDAVQANGGPKKTKDLIRLFMIPGKAHCGNPFDQMEVITRWVEQGVAPDTITVSYAAVTAGDAPHGPRIRKVCAWPQTSRYKGQGSVDDAASFACVKSGT